MRLPAIFVRLSAQRPRIIANYTDNPFKDWQVNDIRLPAKRMPSIRVHVLLTCRFRYLCVPYNEIQY
jgi:hypothetical protein